MIPVTPTVIARLASIGPIALAVSALFAFTAPWLSPGPSSLSTVDSWHVTPACIPAAPPLQCPLRLGRFAHVHAAALSAPQFAPSNVGDRPVFDRWQLTSCARQPHNLPCHCAQPDPADGEQWRMAMDDTPILRRGAAGFRDFQFATAPDTTGGP